MARSSTTPDLPGELWEAIMARTKLVDAARLAFLSSAAFQAFRATPAHQRAVRVAPTSGRVLPPLDEEGFSARVEPGQNMQASVNACPSGGSILLLPGVHRGTLVLPRDKVVHVFGRDSPVIQPYSLERQSAVVVSKAKKSTLVGIRLRSPTNVRFNRTLLLIRCGNLRLQDCDLVSTNGTCMRVSMGGPTLQGCQLRNSRIGVDTCHKARPILVDTLVTGMTVTAVRVESAVRLDGGNRVVDNSGQGVLLANDHSTISHSGPPNEIARNVGGDVVGPGRDAQLRREAHEACQDQHAVDDAALRAKLEGIPDEMLAPEPEHERFDAVVDSASFHRADFMDSEDEAPAHVLLKPGLYERLPQWLHNVRLYGRGLVTLLLDWDDTLLVSDVVMDGIRIKRREPPDAASAPGARDWTPIAEGRGNAYAVYALGGDVRFQACRFQACAFAGIGVRSTAMAKVFACHFSGGDLCGIAFNAAVPAFTLTDPPPPSLAAPSGPAAPPSPVNFVRDCSFGASLGACVRVERGHAVRLTRCVLQVGGGGGGVWLGPEAAPCFQEGPDLAIVHAGAGRIFGPGCSVGIKGGATAEREFHQNWIRMTALSRQRLIPGWSEALDSEDRPRIGRAVAPGEDVQAAVDRCSLGGSVWLLPGIHDGPITLRRDVRIWGRGRAILRSPFTTAIMCLSGTSIVDGVRVVCNSDIGGTVRVQAGSLVLQSCHVDSLKTVGLCVVGGRLTAQGCQVTAGRCALLAGKDGASAEFVFRHSSNHCAGTQTAGPAVVARAGAVASLSQVVFVHRPCVDRTLAVQGGGIIHQENVRYEN